MSKKNLVREQTTPSLNTTQIAAAVEHIGKDVIDAHYLLISAVFHLGRCHHQKKATCSQVATLFTRVYEVDEDFHLGGEAGLWYPLAEINGDVLDLWMQEYLNPHCPLEQIVAFVKLYNEWSDSHLNLIPLMLHIKNLCKAYYAQLIASEVAA
jgi:hypothetical protein